MGIKEKESKFENIAYEFSEGNEKYTLGKIALISINKFESSIASLINIDNINQLWQPKFSEGKWFILRLDNILSAEFDNNLKKLFLVVGKKFLDKKFNEIQIT